METENLSAVEKKVLKALGKTEDNVLIQDLASRTNLDQSVVSRAALSLQKFGMVEIEEGKIEKLLLTEEGRKYAEVGLPERRLLKAIVQNPEKPPSELSSLAQLNEGEMKIALTWVKRKGWAKFVRRDGETVLSPTSAGKTACEKDDPEEEILRAAVRGPIELKTLDPETKRLAEVLKKRGILEVEEKTLRRLRLTESGRGALEKGIEEVEEITELTRETILGGKWRKARLRKYDVLAPCPPIYPGKSHPQQQVIDELREILLEMGFVEIKSRIVDSEFWNFDALFQAQDHPAREIHDSLSVKTPSQTKLPSPSLVRRVAAAHEKGVAGSIGWRYKFNLEISKRPILCSQTTAATVRYLASKPKPPVKVFCIDRVYRHEHIDYKHLAEFYQCEGIVMDKGLTLRDMLGYLKLIVNKLGLEKIRFRPGYFPYTEPSVEADVYFPEKGEWLEILGAGMFRPELLRPLGIKHPVLAWGIGFSRLAMIKLGIDDIRELYCPDLKWIRERRVD